MIKKVSLVLLILSSISGYSQEKNESTIEINLQQAVELGLKNRYDIQSHKYNVDLNQNEISKSKKEWLPEISSTGSVIYNTQIQQAYVPAGFSPNGQPALFPFSPDNHTSFSLELNQPIFKPGIGTDVKISKNKLELSKEKNRADEDIIKEQITLAYYNVTLKELQQKIAINEEMRYKQYADLNDGKFKAGTLIETDNMKAKLDYENAKVETQKAKQNYGLALAKLKYEINVSDNTAITLSESLDSASYGKLNETMLSASDTNKRTEIKQLIIKKEGLKLELDRTRQAAIPTVSLVANFTEHFQYSNFDYSLGQWWTPYSYVGMQFKIPISSNIKNQNEIHERKMQIAQNELDLKQKTADVSYEILKSQTEVFNAQQNMQMTKNNYELSEKIFNYQKQQFELGSRLYSDILETERTLRQSEQNYIQSVYDYLSANVSHQKAIGAF
ncbi:TolC family protein [Flavobacterium gelatinilyticum]|uniref:TolC family protein n=1 Tax=Flavobacterium gelatinilyticum TaxID=3003260 RepID=UPI0024800BB5|nr:TolC family protein [Flavobacterium gelatinilyticum]